MILRQGRKVARNLYLQQGDDPSDGDQDIGRVDHAGLARVLVVLFNRYRPECVMLCRPDCPHGEAHCKWAHLPHYVKGWHGELDCPWTELVKDAATKEGDAR